MNVSRDLASFTDAISLSIIEQALEHYAQAPATRHNMKAMRDNYPEPGRKVIDDLAAIFDRYVMTYPSAVAEDLLKDVRKTRFVQNGYDELRSIVGRNDQFISICLAIFKIELTFPKLTMSVIKDPPESVVQFFNTIDMTTKAIDEVANEFGLELPKLP